MANRNNNDLQLLYTIHKTRLPRSLYNWGTDYRGSIVIVFFLVCEKLFQNNNQNL